MNTIPTTHGELQEYAEANRRHEAQVKEQLLQHREVWGEGPPFFSEGSFEFWAALNKGRFCLGKCGACGHVYFPPRVICPECWAQDVVQLADTPAMGTLVSFTELHVVAPALQSLAPVLMAVIDLDEGVRLLTWLRGPGAGNAKVRDRCRIVVEHVVGRNWFVANLAA